MTQDAAGNSIGSGEYSIPTILNELVDLVNSPRGERLIITGDFNLWPVRIPEELYEVMIDLVDATAESREPLPGCSGCWEDDICGHMWTHKNGNGPNSAVQNIDYMFMAPELVDNFVEIYGGEADFEGIWDVSDHAPIVAELEFEI